MARLVIGVFLTALFVLSLVAAGTFHPARPMIFIAVAGVILLVPGIVLIALGRRRIALIRKVGGAVLASARETGHISISDIAAQTQASPDDVRLVVDIFSKRGILPRDTEIL